MALDSGDGEKELGESLDASKSELVEAFSSWGETSGEQHNSTVGRRPLQAEQQTEQAEQQTEQTEQAEQYSKEQMVSLRDMSYLINSF